MAGSIRLHPKHGVNPTVTKCYFCGQSKNEVALLGAAYKGEAPMSMVLDYVPCDSCKAEMDAGIAFIEMTRAVDRPALQDGMAPTGRYIVLKREALGSLNLPEELHAQVLKVGKAFIDTEMFDWLNPKDGSDEVPTFQG